MITPPSPQVTHPETKPGTPLTVVETAADWKAFHHVPELVYWGDPYWVPPQKKGVRSLFERASNPFLGHGEARLWVAWHGHGHPIGRIAAFLDRDYDTRTGKRWGFFGFLELMNDARIPEALLAEAVAWLRAKGAEEIAGPCMFTTSFAQRGLLVDGFYDDPVIASAYNPSSYLGFLQRLGLETWYDDLGFALDTTAPPPEPLAAKAREVAARDGLAVRRVDLGRFDSEWEAIRELNDEACRDLPRYVPIAKEDHEAWRPRMLAWVRVFPKGALILEQRGRPVGCALALADMNRVAKHLGGSSSIFAALKALLLRRTVDRVRVNTLCVLGKGRGHAAVLAHALWQAIRARGYRSAHIHAVYADNERALTLAGKLGAKRTHVWRMFKLPKGFQIGRTPERPAGL